MKTKIRLLTKIILALFASNTLSVSGQKTPYELSIYGGGGLAAFCFQPSIKNASSKGYSVDAGVGFTAFFSQNWGVHVGAGLGFYDVKNKVNDFKFITPDQKDCEDNLFDLHTTLNKYKETHQAIFLTVPLMLQFQTKTNLSNNRNKDEKVGYYFVTGVKALFPLNCNRTSEIASFNNAAYYPQFDNWIHSLPILGLGSFDGAGTTEKLKFGALTMFVFETGAKWRIGNNFHLYTGVYFDCGLHDPIRKNRVPYSVYRHPEQFQEISLLEYTDTMTLMAAGIKIRLTFIPTQNNCFNQWWKGVKKVYKH